MWHRIETDLNSKNADRNKERACVNNSYQIKCINLSFTSFLTTANKSGNFRDHHFIETSNSERPLNKRINKQANKRELHMFLGRCQTSYGRIINLWANKSYIIKNEKCWHAHAVWMMSNQMKASVYAFIPIIYKLPSCSHWFQPNRNLFDGSFHWLHSYKMVILITIVMKSDE